MEEYKMTKGEFIKEMKKNGAKKEDIEEYLEWRVREGCPYKHCPEYWLGIGMSKEEFIKEIYIIRCGSSSNKTLYRNA